MSSTLVTGGMGYIGRIIVKQLAEQGQHVVTYDRDYSDARSSSITAVQGELYDLPRLIRTFEKHDVDRIIHTAAMSHPDLSVELPMTTVVANIDGTVNLFEAMRIGGVKRVVQFSSETVYGHHDGPIDEASPTWPTTPYGVTKVAVEHFGRVYRDLYGLSIVSLRVSEVYGPGNRMPQVLRDMLKTILRNRPFRMASGGDHLFHFVHADDVARVAVLASRSESLESSIFNVFGDRPWRLADAARLVKKLLPDADIEIGDGYCQLDRQGPWSQDAASRELGYVPQHDLESGLTSYIDWLRTHED